MVLFVCSHHEERRFCYPHWSWLCSVGQGKCCEGCPDFWQDELIWEERCPYCAGPLDRTQILDGHEDCFRTYLQQQVRVVRRTA